MTTQTIRRRRRSTREPKFDWARWYREHLCICTHVDQIHGKGGCEGVQEDGPCPCQGFTQKEAVK